MIDDLFLLATDTVVGGTRWLGELLMWPGRKVCRLLPFFRRREPATTAVLLAAALFWVTVVLAAVTLVTLL